MRIRCCVLLFLACSASAQGLREQIEVDVVEIPVHVIRRGKAVTGLTKDVFEVTVNGQPQEIEYFDVIDTRGAALPLVAQSALGPDAAAAVPAQYRRLTVLVFDTVAMTYRYLTRASEAAQKYVKKAPRAETFAVARLDADGVQFLVPFTNDRVAVLRAVQTLQPSKARDLLGLATLDAERKIALSDTALAAMQTLPDPAVSESGMSGDGLQGVANARAARRFVNREILLANEIRTAESLSLLADALAPITGVKHAVLFAEGGRRTPEPRSAARMHARFQAASVVLDAVEVESMRVPGYSDAEMRVESGNYRQVTERSEALYTLALGTGGTVALHSDIVKGLQLLGEIQGLTYILGFRQPKNSRPHNDVTVKVKNQPFGTTVTYRRGYGTGPRATGNDSLFLADVIANDIAQRALTVNLDVHPQIDGANVVVSVPGRELLARQDDGPQTEVDVFLYVFNDSNVVREWSYWRLAIDLEKGRPYLSSFPYEIERLFTTLGPGRYTAKALLRFVNTDAIAFQRTDFEMPAR